MNSHVGVASHGNMRYYVASANAYHNSGYHVQGLISTMIFQVLMLLAPYNMHILIHRLQAHNMWFHHKTSR